MSHGLKLEMTQMADVHLCSRRRCRFSGILRRMLDISDSRISTFVSISLSYRYTANEQNATSPPRIVLEVLLATDWLWLRLTSGNIQWLHRSH